ncbi:MAG: ferrous iron transport protein A [Anaerolineales bacterium]|nr:ferrous iron transport protein A [Anaerolineales bacterium]
MQHSSDLVPLTLVGSGRSVTLIKISAGRKLVHRLSELGLTPGVRFEIIQDHGGPLVLAVRNSRLALGRGMASQILVAPA